MRRGPLIPEQFKTCGKCGIEQSLHSYTDNSHYLDNKFKTCKECRKLDVKSRGDFKGKKLSEEIQTITDAILDRTHIDEDIVTYAWNARYSIFYPYRASPYKLHSLKNELIAKCQRIEFDYKQYSKNTGA